jgi:catechol 2,3-dioxygenase-like lactoylglutathione lyase family enzyme
VFSHIMVGVNNLERALEFYKPILDYLDIQFRFINTERCWAGWQSNPDSRPLFLIGRPYNKQPHNPGNGQMVAFLANSRQQVNYVHELALTNGGVCEGPPNLRPEYHANYYGAYFRDPDGNKLCIACHLAV